MTFAQSLTAEEFADWDERFGVPLQQLWGMTETVGLPLMYPPPTDGGTVVSGFDTPSTSAVFTFPADVRSRVLERFPDYGFVATPDSGSGNPTSPAGPPATVRQPTGEPEAGFIWRATPLASVASKWLRSASVPCATPSSFSPRPP